MMKVSRHHLIPLIVGFHARINELSNNDKIQKCTNTLILLLLLLIPSMISDEDINNDNFLEENKFFR